MAHVSICTVLWIDEGEANWRGPHWELAGWSYSIWPFCTRKIQEASRSRTWQDMRNSKVAGFELRFTMFCSQWQRKNTHIQYIYIYILIECAHHIYIYNKCIYIYAYYYCYYYLLLLLLLLLLWFYYHYIIIIINILLLFFLFIYVYSQTKSE
jgi:hypothetical protein